MPPTIQETVPLINRTKGPLKVTFDGMDIPIKPGINYGFPAVCVAHAKAQNPVMGTKHPYNPTKFESLVGVEGTSDPVTPIEQSDSVELYDRSKIGGLADQAVAMRGQPVTAWEATEGLREIDSETLVGSTAGD